MVESNFWSARRAAREKKVTPTNDAVLENQQRVILVHQLYSQKSDQTPHVKPTDKQYTDSIPHVQLFPVIHSFGVG